MTFVKARLNRLCISVSFAQVSRHGIINYVYSYKSLYDLVYVLSFVVSLFLIIAVDFATSL